MYTTCLSKSAGCILNHFITLYTSTVHYKGVKVTSFPAYLDMSVIVTGSGIGHSPLLTVTLSKQVSLERRENQLTLAKMVDCEHFRAKHINLLTF